MYYNISINLQTGQLNEYTERKKLSSDVSCMALGSVATGEQRAWFLAVGLVDNTVRVISLDPAVSYIEKLCFKKKYFVCHIII